MRHTRTTRLFLILLATASFLSTPDRALCIGFNGHLAVEPYAEPDLECCPAGGPSLGSETAWVDDVCGPCRDVALPLWTVTRPVRDELPSPVPTQLALPDMAMPAPADLAHGPGGLAGATTFLPNRLRPTTVLRC
jgi:hypothetical protein